jgi:hypothetical protein
MFLHATKPVSTSTSPTREQSPFAQVTRHNVPEIAQAVFSKVFRADWSELGFAILVLPRDTESKSLRQFMVKLKLALSECYRARWGESLEYLSLGRFDQQSTTKLHLDGAPEVSLLMLGYEATTVKSELQIADYTRCARDLGLTPAEFLQRHNPMFVTGRVLLESYTTCFSDWHEEHPRIVLINNSQTETTNPRFSPGVMHGARITHPDPSASRIINSTMITPASCVFENAAAKQTHFLETESISGVI